MAHQHAPVCRDQYFWQSNLHSASTSREARKSKNGNRQMKVIEDTGIETLRRSFIFKGGRRRLPRLIEALTYLYFADLFAASRGRLAFPSLCVNRSQLIFVETGAKRVDMFRQGMIFSWSVPELQMLKMSRYLLRGTERRCRIDRLLVDDASSAHWISGTLRWGELGLIEAVWCTGWHLLYGHSKIDHSLTLREGEEISSRRRQRSPTRSSR